MEDSKEYSEGERLFERRFFPALQSGNEELVVELLTSVENKQYLNEDLLSLAYVQAVLLNNINLVQVLSRHGVDIHTTDSMFGENGIMQAVRYGHADMVTYLLSAGVSVNHQSINGSTALHVAIENQQIGCLNVLISQPGIDLNIQDSGGYSPLLWAARLRDFRAMNILIENGCNVDSRDLHKGINALHVCVDKKQAFWKGKEASSQELSQCIDLLLEAGLEIDKGDFFGNSPLVYAVESNNIQALKHLIKSNCCVNCPAAVANPVSFHFTIGLGVIGCNYSLIALYTAISKLNIRAVKILCTGGASYHQLMYEPGILRFTEKSKPLQDWLTNAVQNSRTLKESARLVIRQCLGHGIRTKLKYLGLPHSLTEYTDFSDFENL